jgi:hypothetical protein
MFLTAVGFLSIVQVFRTGMEHLIKPRDPALVALYYSMATQDYERELRIFARVSEMILDAEFVTINCTRFKTFCIDQQADPLPLIQLWCSARRKGVDMTNEHSPYAIVEFVTTNSFARSLLLPTDNMKQLVYSNYAEFAIRPKCNVVSFMNPRDRQSELLFPTLFELADIFQPEPDVAFGMINCSDNVSFCFSLGIRFAPIVRVYKGTNIWDFVGTRELDPLLEFINQKCGKRRADDGGLALRKPSPEFKEAFAKFLDAANRELFLKEFEGG